MVALPIEEEQVFSIARRIDDGQTRTAYLKQVCGHDPEMLQRIVALLQAVAEPDSFLREPVYQFDSTLDASLSEDDLIGRSMGNYKLLQQIGRGGFGVVYMAEQTEPIRRKVAIKVVKPGMDSREVIARFEAERQALAMMSHPNIARVLGAGTTHRGRPYFVMELVKGLPITRYADENRLSTRERLELLIQVCRAVQHAHQKGVIHRDLKPSNVLVTLEDGRPVPKVIDFGVAKALDQPLTEKTLFTRYEQVLGTPQYMSPEQAFNCAGDIDTRSDIYSLGVLGYELLVGRLPFNSQKLRSGDLNEIRRVIREEEPQVPSQLVRTLDIRSASTIATARAVDHTALCRELRGELDWITMKAMEKDRSLRYQSASELAEELARYLAGDPVKVGPPTLRYRLSKIWRKHRAAMSTAALVLLSLAGGLGFALTGWQRTREALAGERSAMATAVAAQQELRQVNRDLEVQSDAALLEAQNSRHALEMVLLLLSQSGIDPATGKERPISKALDQLAEGLQQNTGLGVEESATLHLGIATAYRNAGERRRAAIHFAQAAEIGGEAWPADAPQLAVARRNAAYLAEDMTAMEEVVREVRQLRSPVERVKSLTLAGSLALEQQRWLVARKFLTEAVEQFPETGGEFRFVELPHLALADVLEQLGETDEAARQREAGNAIARQHFEHLSRATNPDQAWFQHALQLSRAEGERTARHAIQIAETFEPTLDALGIKTLGHQFRDQGAFRLADELYLRGREKAMAVDDENEVGWNLLNRSRLRFHARDLEGAKRLYEETLAYLESHRDEPLEVHAWTYFEFGHLLYFMGEHERAALLFKRCIDYLDANPTVYDQLDRTLFKLCAEVIRGRGEEHWEDILSFLNYDAVRPVVRRVLYVRVRYHMPDREVPGWNDRFAYASLSRFSVHYQSGFFAPYREAYLDSQNTPEQTLWLIDFLEKSIAQRDAHYRWHTEAAWARERLARVLIDQGSQTERAEQLVDQALEILSHNPFVPEARLQQLRDLRDTARASQVSASF